MRTNEFGELMRIETITLGVIDVSVPTGDWVVTVHWVNLHEKSGKAYGGESKTMLVSEAIAQGFMTPEDVTAIYVPLAKLADKM